MPNMSYMKDISALQQRNKTVSRALQMARGGTSRGVGRAAKGAAAIGGKIRDLFQRRKYK